LVSCLCEPPIFQREAQLASIRLRRYERSR
jgi:hypothetical protein